MYKSEFDKLLEKELPKNVLLYGDNEFFLEYYYKLYIERLDAKEDALEHFYEEYNFEQAKAYLSGGSLFGGVNLYILRTNKKINKKELEELISLSSKNPNNYFLYLYEGSSSDAKSLTNIFSTKKKAIWVRFFETTMKEATTFSKEICTKLNIDITPYALNYLITTLNLNLSLIQKELEKLSILNTTIEVSHIDALVYSTAPLSVEKMIISLLQKEDITTTLEKLIELGEDIYSILRSLQRFIHQLFLFHAYIKLYGKPNSKEILGYALPKWVEEERASLAIKIKPAKLLKLYQELLELELTIKQTQGNKEAIFFSKLAQIRDTL